MLGSLILYLKGMRRMMLQLSGFYCRVMGLPGLRVLGFGLRVFAWGVLGAAGSFLGFRSSVVKG